MLVQSARTRKLKTLGEPHLNIAAGIIVIHLATSTPTDSPDLLSSTSARSFKCLAVIERPSPPN